jgi:hypothetical protein
METKDAKIKINDLPTGELISVEVNLPYHISVKDNDFIVRCPVLRVFGHSITSIDDAMQDFEADLDAFFYAHLKNQTLYYALNSLGWKPNGKKEYNKHEVSKILIQNSKFKTKSYSNAATC